MLDICCSDWVYLSTKRNWNKWTGSASVVILKIYRVVTKSKKKEKKKREKKIKDLGYVYNTP